MNILFTCTLLCFVIAASSAPTGNFNFELLEKNQTSARIRFTSKVVAPKFWINVVEKYLADVGADYYTTLTPSDMRDGYFYIETGNTLQPGKLYEVLVIRQTGSSGYFDLYTDCGISTFSCTRSGNPRCLRASELCDAVDDCDDNSDERRDETGACLAQMPATPPPPTPPSNTPCMMERAAAIQADRPSRRVPTCELDGHYESVRCEMVTSYTCHCINPITNQVIYSQPDFHPWVHYNFGKDCESRRASLISNWSGK